MQGRKRVNAGAILMFCCQVKCIQCLHESNGYEPMMDLLVDIQGNAKSVEDALAPFTDTELLDGANKYECDQYVLLMCSGNIGGCFHVHLESQEIE
jgi:ubiquitin C-terminal hydrolase